MSDIVIDTNIRVMADRITSISEWTPEDEAVCIEACYEWLQSFMASNDRLVVDLTYRIVREYRDNIPTGGLAEQELNRLESQATERIAFKQIHFDRDGHAVLPKPFEFADKSDRKFIAVAILCEPYAPIFNATETDWAQEQTALVNYGLTIHELCPDYIGARLQAF